MSLLSKLSIIIPTYNRPDFALRNMTFWSGSEVSVYIVDGSLNPIPSSSMKDLTPNIHYHHIGKSIEERIYFATQRIKTEYAMLCGDDEFMVYSGLKACIEFLERNLDFTVCIGRCIGFNPVKNKIYLSPVKDFHRTHFVNQNSVASRIEYHISNYMVTTFYGVHRTESFKFCFEQINCRIFSCPYVQETLLEMFAAAYGKSKVLPNVTWLRSSENKPVDIDSFNRKYLISDWFDDDSMKEEVKYFQALVYEKLSLICTGEDLAAARKAAVNAIEVRIGLDRISKMKTLLAKTHFYSEAVDLSVRVIVKILRKIRVMEKRSYFTDYDSFSYKYLKKQSGIRLEENELNYVMAKVLDFHGHTK
jgi:glycosyltransferase domain-containing protein